MRVAFLGPAGTFAEEALRASAPGDAEIEEVPYSSVYETVMAVQEGEVDRAVVPIENSLEGAVTATLDALAGEADRVRIAAEVVRPIEHCLVARPGLGIEAVRQVVSHPQAIAQCAGFLRERLPDAETASAPSTADAVRTAARATEPLAALGPRLAAELYGCDVLAEDVQDVSDNATRFVWLAPADTPPEAEPTKTSIVFWGFNDESPGALVRVLSELADREVNLTKIESRPRRVRLGHYMFFADLVGGTDDPAVREALDALSERVQTLKVLGSYPVLPGESRR
ncbi:MAG: prephenate dehydratase [Actinobacteria bacterium]|nr:MAG: prephenate dehydratase [Actinomycetota bacterium]